MKVTTFSIILGIAVAYFANGEANLKIPKGISHYKFKNSEEVAQLLNQVNDFELSQDEVQELLKITRAAAQPGVSALTLENNAPKYTLTYAGITVKFEHETAVPFKFLNRTGSGVYTVDEDNGNISGTNTLENGVVYYVVLFFNEHGVLVSRMTESRSALVLLEKVL